MLENNVATINHQKINIADPSATSDTEKYIFDRLLLEHDHILKSLNLLEMQFLELCRGKTPDYSIAKSIIVYVQEFPEQVHHPLEDMIYAILLERSEQLEFIQELINEHTQLEDIARNLRKSLESVSSNSASLEELKQQLSTFLVRLRQHIHIEEKEVYPLVQSALTIKDWKKLNCMTPILDEPIFGRRTRNDYEYLYHEIKGRCN